MKWKQKKTHKPGDIRKRWRFPIISPLCHDGVCYLLTWVLVEEQYGLCGSRLGNKIIGKWQVVDIIRESKPPSAGGLP
jgi:hypothetical protein